MACSLMRSAIGTAVACGAFVTGPMCVGAAVSNADLLGIGGGGGGVDVLGVDLLGGKKSSGAAGSYARANAVSTAPSARSVVIRSEVQATQPDPSVARISAIVPRTATPAVALGVPLGDAPPAAPPPSAPAPASAPPKSTPPAAPAPAVPAPQAAPITTINQPAPSGRIGPAETFLPKKVPETFRAGYSEYLRRATTTDIVAAALPGAVGIAGFTFVGAYAGYRQARAVQLALLAPVPTRILL